VNMLGAPLCQERAGSPIGSPPAGSAGLLRLRLGSAIIVADRHVLIHYVLEVVAGGIQSSLDTEVRNSIIFSKIQNRKIDENTTGRR
jgi:hypothetical protein